MRTPRDRISREEMLMAMTETVALRGTCSRNRVGVVIAREGRVIVTGYNGAPAGLEHCDHRCSMPHECIRFTGSHHPSCNASKGCEVATHAEANAIAYAARLGIALEGATLYCSLNPCMACARLIINAGISSVIFRRCYRITDAIEYLNGAGVMTIQYDEDDE